MTEKADQPEMVATDFEAAANALTKQIEGKMQSDGTFVADNLLAKHDENYVPRELQDINDQHKKAAVAETTI